MRTPQPSGNITAQNHMPIYIERNLDLYRDGVAGDSASTEQESTQDDITLPNAREVNRQLRGIAIGVVTLIVSGDEVAVRSVCTAWQFTSPSTVL